MKLQKWLPFHRKSLVASRFRCFTTSNSWKSSSATTSHRYRPLEGLQYAHIDHFREQCFVPERPAILPRRLFRDLPAVERWFHPQSPSNSLARLNTEYLERHGANAFVPLEFTQLPTAESESPNQELSFQRFSAPLSLFLQWMETAETQPQQSTRLYLAQCQLLDLPKPLHEDFPIPELVSQAGRGDIYDTNVWIGHPPTYTPLHRDPNPNLFVQLAGEKVVRMVSPDDGFKLFGAARRHIGKSGGREEAAFRGEEMMQGPERALLEKVVWDDADTETDGLTRGREGYEASLEAGDGLFIPKGWWHSIKGIGEGATGSVCPSLLVYGHG